MANTPNENPVNPNLTDAVNRMASASEVFSNAAKTMEASLDAAAKHTEVMMKNLDSTKLADLVAIFDSVEESTKEIAGYARKMRMGIFNSKDAQAAAKYANQILAAQKELQKKTKENTAAWQQANRSASQLQKFVEKIGSRVGELNQDELREFGKLMHEAELSGGKLVKHFRDMKIGNVRSQLHAIAQVVAPGYSKRADARRDKALARQADIVEQQRARLQGGRINQADRRERAIQQLKKADPNFDLRDEGSRRLLSDRMGFRGERAKRFVRGEHQLALGGTTGGADYEKLMSHGSGVGGGLSEIATIIEDLGATFEGAMALFAPEIELLVIAIGALVEAFDGFTKQNKEIEKAVGQGGIFNLGGDAFGAARNNLTPRMQSLGGILGYQQLGVTFERNLALAGGLVGAGRGAQDLVTGGPEIANQMPGANGEFMQGPMGQIQRIAFGGGRLAGLTDQQTVETIVKNLDQYGQTLEGTEKFFIQINKDTKAAGISTTKYLQIIDEVAGHFDRMNKSLDQTMGFLRELGRTGAISTESLKDLMDFLAGAQKPDMGNVAQRGYMQIQMGKGPLVNAGIQGERNSINQLVQGQLRDNLQHLFPGSMMPNIDDLAHLPPAEALRRIRAIRDRVQHATDAQGRPVSNNFTAGSDEALGRLEQSYRRLDAMSRKGGLDRAAMLGLTGNDLIASATQQFGSINEIAARAHVPVSALMTGDYTGISGKQAMMMQSVATQVTGIADPQKALASVAGIGQRATNARLDAAHDNHALALDIVKEIGGPKSKLFRDWLSKHPGKLAQDGTYSMETAAEFLEDMRNGTDEQHGDLNKLVAGSKQTQAWFIKNATTNKDISNQMEADALDNARRVARQTIGIEDAIKNALHTWMTRLVSGVEWLVDHVPLRKGTEEDTKTLADEFSKTQDQLKPALDQLHKSMGANRSLAANADEKTKGQLDDEYEKMVDIERQLQDTHDLHQFNSQKQAEEVGNAVKSAFTFGGSAYIPGKGAPDTYATGVSYGATAAERGNMSTTMSPQQAQDVLRWVNGLGKGTQGQTHYTFNIGVAHQQVKIPNGPNQSGETPSSDYGVPSN